MSKRIQMLESVAKLALKVAEVNLTDPMQLILHNLQLANLSALAKLALNEPVSTIDRSKCCDCGSKEVFVHWGLGSRCSECSKKHAEKIEAKQKAKREDELADMAKHEYKSMLDGHCPDDGVTCTECCEHGEYDHGICLYCGLDRSEEFSARAYDAAKDAKKYGDT